MEHEDSRSDGLRKHAVVLGASVAGLLAARVLSERFERVTIVERDVLPDGPLVRRGVPQARHVHTCLPRGTEVLEDLFPGISAELLADGATLLDRMDRFHLQFQGDLLDRTVLPLSSSLPASRPLLEARIRGRVLALPNVQVCEHTSAVGPSATRDRSRITGVRVADTAGGDAETLAADLVVDCTGRAAHGQAWLCQLGYDRPEEERVHVGLTCVSAQLRLLADPVVPELVLIGPRPGQPVGLGLFAYEDRTWTLTVAVIGAGAPAPDLVQMLHCIAPVAPPPMLA